MDPSTGFHVFTELAHRQRGRCCGCGCRHCPYQHANLTDKSRAQQPSWLTPFEVAPAHTARPTAAPHKPAVDVLFWSGGKDSFLALRALMREQAAHVTTASGTSAANTEGTDSGGARRAGSSVVLLTTYDASSRVVAHQEVGIADIMRQAAHLQLPLVGVPLHPGLEYLDRVGQGLQLVAHEARVARLCFGDLHLEHVRAWRDGQMPRFGSLHYPLWRTAYEVLLDDLEASKVPCALTALAGLEGTSVPQGMEVGRAFDRGAYSLSRSAGWDGFGENGEFHSLAKVWEVPRTVALGLSQPS